MKENDTIAKNPKRDFGADFLALKEAGIEYIQQLSGNHWTDFNHHDPGITILEQLCYGITEISNQTRLDYPELLCSPDRNEPDYGTPGLSLPREVFSHYPMQPADYSRLLFDGIREVANAWLIPHKSGQNAGLYTIYLFINDFEENLTETVRRRIRTAAKELFLANRNLCEDLADIDILKYKTIDIKAHIEIDPEQKPYQILADIVMNIQNSLAPKLRFYSYHELKTQDREIQDIFDGPQLKNGLITPDQCKEKPRFVDEQTLVECISQTRDVEDVRHLELYDDDGNAMQDLEAKPDELIYYRLNYETLTDNLKLFLSDSGRQVKINEELFKQLIRRRNEKEQHRVFRKRAQTVKPHHTRLHTFQPDDYYSIQNDFPAIYGINQYGVPSSESDFRKAQAKQLKAYLMLFEYILAGSTSLVSSIGDVMSGEETGASYPFQFLDNNKVPDSEVLYADFDSSKEALEKIWHKYDSQNGRYGRILDFLISLYGERCTLYSVSQFDHYSDRYEKDQHILDLKKRFLNSVEDLCYNRSGAFDYTKLYDPANNISGLEKKAAILLDFNTKGRSMIERSCRSVFHTYGLEIVSTSELEDPDCYRVTPEGSPVIEIIYNNRAAELYFEKAGFLKSIQLNDKTYYETLGDLKIKKQGYVDSNLLINGIDPDNYRIGKISNTGICLILLRSTYKGEEVWRDLGRTRNASEACDTVLTYIRLFRELSRASEGMHVLENILLRPMNPEGQNRQDANDDFYANRLSIFLPDWTARLSDAGFRELVRETLILLVPAHLYTHVYWLNPEQMCDFEKRYNKWLSQRSVLHGDPNILDELAWNLRGFIEQLNSDHFLFLQSEDDQPEEENE